MAGALPAFFLSASGIRTLMLILMFRIYEDRLEF